MCRSAEGLQHSRLAGVSDTHTVEPAVREEARGRQVSAMLPHILSISNIFLFLVQILSSPVMHLGHVSRRR
ncbi:hypothetical protein scyTo_0006238 [Scyliorhinus torazame]|uniref:Uncharacterized protein n=1 Tax=Scyliorhinus torazame TaxID=75743 RepID=A0A401PGP2_SCYTO|nr:hypothetical protein [Scyliorhinus torazame]